MSLVSRWLAANSLHLSISFLPVEFILCLHSLHVDSIYHTCTSVGRGGLGARQKARGNLLGKKAMAEAVGWMPNIALFCAKYTPGAKKGCGK
jgi:hypothetical protein